MKKVKIIRWDKIYTTYNDWIKKNFPRYEKLWIKNAIPEPKDRSKIYDLIGTKAHEWNINNKLGLIQDPDTKQVYIYSMEGLEIVNNMKKEFSKSDLRDGDIVIYRNGRKRFVKNDYLIDDNGRWSLSLEGYKDNLTHTFHHEYDIVKIERPLTEVLYEVPTEILDDKEKEYLRAVIKPFRNRLKYIKKTSAYYGKNKERLWFHIGDCINREQFCLPLFDESTMYKGMELDKKYTLEELGL